LIEPERDPVQVRLREAREICSPGEILSQQAVGVLVAAALPRTACRVCRSAIGFQSDVDLKIFIQLHKGALI